MFEQLAAPEQAFRLGNRWDWAALAVDAWVATTHPLSGSRPWFHAYFVFDTFAALRSPYGLDINLNLVLFNPSASDGVRASAYALPAGNLHFYHEFEVAGREARVDLLGPDLGMTTLGSGLLLEHWPLEGAFFNWAIDDYYLRHYFGGRAFWPNDDLLSLQAGALGGQFEVMAVAWHFSGSHIAWYLDASARIPLADGRVQLSGEYATHLRDRLRHGLLLRGDYRDGWAGLEWHLGYQFRWYDQGFGPRRDLEMPSTQFNLPHRGEQYVNNSFEYFGASEWFEQWSHGVMAELEAPLGPGLRAFAQGELIAGFSRDGSGQVQWMRLVQGRALPGPWFDAYYQAGLRLYPWPMLPHRLSVLVTNKQVDNAPYWLQDATHLRFVPEGQWISLQMEAFL